MVIPKQSLCVLSKTTHNIDNWPFLHFQHRAFQAKKETVRRDRNRFHLEGVEFFVLMRSFFGESGLWASLDIWVNSIHFSPSILPDECLKFNIKYKNNTWYLVIPERNEML
jgi:hypothetical protein